MNLKSLNDLKKPYYFKCDCGHAIIEVYKWADDQPPLVNLSFYEIGLNKDNRYGWREKLRHCWKIIKTGSAYADEFVFSSEDASRFAKTISELLNE